MEPPTVRTVFNPVWILAMTGGVCKWLESGWNLYFQDEVIVTMLKFTAMHLILIILQAFCLGKIHLKRYICKNQNRNIFSFCWWRCNNAKL